MYLETSKRIHKLKKKHIWPSILLFFTYIVIVDGLSKVAVTMFTESIAKTKFSESEHEAEHIGQLLDSMLFAGNDETTALSYIGGQYQEYDAFAVLDKNDKIIESYGDITVLLEKKIHINQQNEYSFYYDRKDQDWISSDGELKLPYKRILLNVVKSTNDFSKDWLEETVYHVPYWAKVRLSSSSRSLLVKTSLTIYRNDLIYLLGFGAVVVILLFMPLVFLMLNVISRVNTQRQMYKLIYTDPITKGKNWTFFLQYAEKVLCSIFRANRTYAIVDLQLEKYRSYCACYGVDAGEKMLEIINQSINHQLAKKELCVRYAKSNFALLLSSFDEEECKNRIQDFSRQISETSMQRNLSFHAGVFMLYPIQRNETGRFVKRSHLNIPQIYNYASEARASIDEKEDAVVAFFDQKMIDEQLWVNWVETHMEQAMENEEFLVYLQPKFDPSNDQLVGAEALVRWISPEKGFITPNLFIPLFEKNGFITKLDDYMVSQVAKEQSRWLREGREIVPISVNVSRAHFTTDDLAEHLCSLVDVYQVPHNIIEIELTESAFFDDKKVLLNTVKKLKEYGFELSMDDFGAGYSSLNSLKDLPLDVLKIDAEFFRGEDTEKRGDLIVSEAIHLAKRLNMRTVAEGIETKEQVDFLANNGCDMIQGFYYAKPMPIIEYEQRAFQERLVEQY